MKDAGYPDTFNCERAYSESDLVLRMLTARVAHDTVRALRREGYGSTCRRGPNVYVEGRGLDYRHADEIERIAERERGFEERAWRRHARTGEPVRLGGAVRTCSRYEKVEGGALRCAEFEPETGTPTRTREHVPHSFTSPSASERQFPIARRAGRVLVPPSRRRH